MIDGQLPKPELNEVISASDGNVEAVDVVVINERVVQTSDQDGLRLTISAVDGEGNLLPMNSQGMLEIGQRQSFAVSGRGLRPNSSAVAWLFSTPVRLGVAKVDSGGSFSTIFTPTSEIANGNHTVQLNAIDISGRVRSVNLAVRISSVPIATITSLDSGSLRDIDGSGREEVNYLLVAALLVSIIISSFLLILLLHRRNRNNDQ